MSNTLDNPPAKIKSHANLDRQFSPRLDVLDIAGALDPLSRAVIDHPAPLPPRPKYGIDAAGLLEVARITRVAPLDQFCMNYWCGTKVCAIGHFIKAHPEDQLKAEILNGDGFTSIAERFGISVQDSFYLFDSAEYVLRHDEDGSYIGIGRDEVAERIEQYVSEHQEHSECRACGEIYGVDPDKAAEAMYCPACEKKHRDTFIKGIVIGLHG